MDSLLLDFGTLKLHWQAVLLSFLCSFFLSSLVAIVYERTFQGLSWSRGLMQSMVLGSAITCLLMIAIGDNIARGIGIVGSLAIIRFRTNLRDPRDLVFLFAALGAGVACGVQSYIAAFVGTLFFCAIALTMQASSFGIRRQYDGLIRFQIPAGPTLAAQVAEIMQAIPRTFALVTLRNVAQGDLVDYTYQVKLARETDSSSLMEALENLEGIRGLTYMNHTSTVEV
ncbi:MAG: DUF4956 domain-containing protein [Candidatus Latescibacterota bacterium]|nr:DUF4956 domain-containing protein [Candidatus Latescibacterota bacterium]